LVRSARNAGKVIRVLHVTEGWIGARAPQGEFVHVGFGEQDGALFEQHVGKRRIRLWAIVLEEWRSRRGGKAGRIDVVLDDDRQCDAPGARRLSSATAASALAPTWSSPTSARRQTRGSANRSPPTRREGAKSARWGGRIRTWEWRNQNPLHTMSVPFCPNVDALRGGSDLGAGSGDGFGFGAGNTNGCNASNPCVTRFASSRRSGG